MSFGKMNMPIDIVTSEPTKDADGFAVKGERVIASTRAYIEERHGNSRWANLAAFSSATVLFRFRKIPDADIRKMQGIIHASTRYRVISAEDVRRRGMYTEVLADKVEGTVR